MFLSDWFLYFLLVVALLAFIFWPILVACYVAWTGVTKFIMIGLWVAVLVALLITLDEHDY